MEFTHGDISSKENKQSEVDFEIGDFDFKPITSGLGFHHEKAIAKTSSKKPIVSKVANGQNKRELLKNDFEKQNNSIGELAAFYGQTYKNEVEVESISTSIQDDSFSTIEKNEASIVNKFIAWMLDIIIAVALVASVQIFSFLFLRLELSDFSNFTINEFVQIFLPVMAFLYIFYTSFMTRVFGRTVGMYLLDLKLEVRDVSGKLKQPTFGMTFSRYFLGLVSILFLGMPILLKLIDRVTNTKIVKAN